MPNRSSTPNPTLTVLIVNYNGRKFLANCLDSISRYVSCTHEVVVVDNASVDGSVDFLRTNYPEVRLLQSSTNLGFARGNNLGAAAANGKYLLLLNNDTLLLDDVTPALDLLEGNPRIGIIGATMLDGERRWCASTGNFPSPFRLILFSSILHSFRCMTRTLHNLRSCEVDWAQGSFLLMEFKTYRLLGGLDEEYFMYVEDVDFCKRASLSGLSTVYCSDVSYVHFGGFKRGRWHLLYEGFRRYHRKFSSLPVRIAAYTVLHVGRVLRSIIYGSGARSEVCNE